MLSENLQIKHDPKSLKINKDRILEEKGKLAIEL